MPASKRFRGRRCGCCHCERSFRHCEQSEAIQTKAAPNNYRSDRVSGDPSVIARSPCDEAIQGPQHARRQQPRRSYCGPWIASLRSQ